MKLNLSTRKNRVVKHWNRLYREVVETQSVDVFKTQLGMVLFWMVCENLSCRTKHFDVIRRCNLFGLSEHCEPGKTKGSITCFKAWLL